MDVKVVSLIVIVIVSVCFTNATIIVQAPKYVPKSALQRLIWKYVKEAQNLRTQTNKEIEFEIPIIPPHGKNPKNPRRGNANTKTNDGMYESKSLPIQRNKLKAQKNQPMPIQTVNDWFAQFRRTPSSIALSTHPSLVLPPDSYFIEHRQPDHRQFPDNLAQINRNRFGKGDPNLGHSNLIQSQQKLHGPKMHNIKSGQLKAEVLAHARKMVEEEQRLQASNLPGKPVTKRIQKLKDGDVVYKEDLDEALSELADRLSDKRNNKKPVYKDDLKQALEEFERKYKDRQEYLATTTTHPCGKERILEEGLKPALKKDLWDYLEDSELRRSSGIIGGNEMTLIGNRRNTNGKSGLFIDQNKIEFGNDILNLVKKGAVIGNDPLVLQKQGLIPVRIEVPKSYKELVIKTG